MSQITAARCTVSDADLLAYRDQELSSATTTALAAHVAGCVACQRRLAAAGTVTATLRAASPLRDAARGRAAVHAALDRQRGRWWELPVPRGVALAALLTIIVLTGFRWWELSRDCASCAPPPAPAGPLITRIAGLPASMAVAPLLCLAPDAGEPAFMPARRPGTSLPGQQLASAYPTAAGAAANRAALPAAGTAPAWTGYPSPPLAAPPATRWEAPATGGPGGCLAPAAGSPYLAAAALARGGN